MRLTRPVWPSRPRLGLLLHHRRGRLCHISSRNPPRSSTPAWSGERGKSFINERLLATVNYEMNINRLEVDKEFKALFKALFKKHER